MKRSVRTRGDARTNAPAAGTMKRVLRTLKPYGGLILLSVLLSAAAVALTLYIPVLVGRAIDRILGPGQVDFAGIARLLGMVAACAAMTALVQWLVSVINNRVTYRVVRDIRDRAFRRLQRSVNEYLNCLDEQLR